MNNSVINDIINELSIILNRDCKEISGQSRLSDLGIDSLSIVELFVFVEGKYKIALMDSDINQNDLVSVSSFANCICRNLNHVK